MTRVFILRSDPQAAARLQSDIETTPRLHVVGIARHAFRARQLVGSSEADVLVTDLRLPDGSAVSLLHDLHRASAVDGARMPRLLLLTPSVDDALLLEAIRAGADGYHVEHEPGRSIGIAIAETMRDEAVMAPPIARQVTGYFSASSDRPAPLKLSDADRDLLMRLSRGQAPADIARFEPEAGTASAVRQRIRQIYRKMQWDLRVAMQQAQPI